MNNQKRMITRRNFIIIIILMAVMFCLFQLSQVLLVSENDYSRNQYATNNTIANSPWQQAVYTLSEINEPLEDYSYILFLGDSNTNIGSIVSQWTNYTKRSILTIDSVKEYSIEKYGRPEFFIVDSNFVDYTKDAADIRGIADSGVSVVFCNLPDAELIQDNNELKDMFGVSFVKDKNAKVTGYKLFSGFLLGGEVIYQPKKATEEKRQDLDMEIPWYVTSGGSKTYMIGLTDDLEKEYEYKDDYYPAVIWRHSLDNSQVFCVNGDYMSTTAGLGILSSMIYELSNYQIYPVVNAQNTLVLNYPMMSNENDDEFFDIYTRSVDNFQTTVIWPSLVSLSEKNSIKYTCFMTPKYNHSDPSKPFYDTYNNLLLLFNERDTELAWSLEHSDGVSLLDKIDYDSDYYLGLEEKYEFSSAFMDIDDIDDLDRALKNSNLKKVRTIACDEDVSIPILSYVDNDITLQSLTSNTKNFTYSKDLMLKSIETALGYDNAKLDISNAVWPESDEDHWEKLYDDMSSSLSTYWAPFRVFDRTTLAESDQHVRVFLNISSSSYRDDETIHLNVKGLDGETCWYILRTHGEDISSADGASYIKIEEDAYLLTITSENVVVNLKSTRTAN